MGVLFITMHLLGMVLFSSSFSLHPDFEIKNPSGQMFVFFSGSGLPDLLSYMSSCLTHSPLHSLISHSKLLANACLRKWPREKGALKSCIRPSFLFLGPVRGKRHLFYFQQPKRKSALHETCLFMEMVEG